MAVSVNYRLANAFLFLTDKKIQLNAVLQSIADVKASLRYFVIIIIEDIRVGHCGFRDRCEDRVQVSSILSAGCIDRQSCDEEDVE